MDTQANQAGMEILSNTVALLNRVTILKEQNDELRVELEDKTNLRWSLESKIGELEVKVGVLQKSNANMAQVIGKESEHVKRLETVKAEYCEMLEWVGEGRFRDADDETIIEKWKQRREKVKQNERN